MDKTFLNQTFAFLLLFGQIIGLTPTISAQPIWEKVNGPNESIAAITSTSNNDVYIGTNSFGVLRSSNAGVSWINISDGLDDPLIRALGTSTNDDIFVSTGDHGIYRFSSGTWTQINTGLPASNLVAWGFATGANGTMYMITTSDNVYKWDGSSWSSIKFNLPALARAISVGSTGIIYVGCFNSGVYSFNGSNTWTSLAPMPNSFITKMVMSSTDTLYVACNSNNIYRKPAIGGSWAAINTGLPVLNVSAMCADAQSNLFMGYNVSGYGQIYRSTNRGASWSVVSSALSTSPFYSFCATISGLLYGGAAGVYKSANQGNVWQDMNPGLDARKEIVGFTGAADGKLYVSAQHDGVWISDDNGYTWQRKSTGLTTLNSINITTNAAGDLFQTTYIPGTTLQSFIFRSTNDGENWTQVASNGTDFYTNVKQHEADTIWATGRFGGPVLSYSINNGANWVNKPIPGFSAIWDIEFAAPHTIFLGSESEGVSRSTDGGKTWTYGVGNSIPWYGNVYKIEMDNNGALFAGSDWYTHTAWFSPPGSNGDVWVEFLDNDLNTMQTVTDLVFDNNNNAYMSTNNGLYAEPVYMANNSVWNANTDWVSASVGLPSEAKAAALEFDAAGYMYVVLYLNTEGQGGLYRSTVPVNNGALSVEFADPIRAYKVKGGNEVEWATATEQNCSHFEIERSKNGIDFNKITSVSGHGSTNKYHRYSAFDHHPFDGINYYRIKEIDLDGKYIYSKILAVQNDHFTVNIYPNPSTGILYFECDNTIETIEISNYLGQKTKIIDQPSSSIDLSDLPKGLYLITLWVNSTPQVVKLLKH
jgi:photosystem II stability/assembly factor-like uncharacterized protein